MEATDEESAEQMAFRMTVRMDPLESVGAAGRAEVVEVPPEGNAGSFHACGGVRLSNGRADSGELRLLPRLST